MSVTILILWELDYNYCLSKPICKISPLYSPSQPHVTTHYNLKASNNIYHEFWTKYMQCSVTIFIYYIYIITFKKCDNFLTKRNKIMKSAACALLKMP